MHLADGVQRTTFEDGTEVIADTTARELFVNGTPIDCPAALRHSDFLQGKR